MERKDLRNFVLSLTLGDGCLHYTSNKVSGALTISHGIKQADYMSWKAKLLSDMLHRNVKVRNAHKGSALQLSVCVKRFKAWRNWLYPNNEKNIVKILKYINNPTMAVAIWLMDDGYVEPSTRKLKDGTRKAMGGSFRIFTCSVPIEDHENIIQWFAENLEVSPWVRFQRNSKKDISYPFLKFSTEDSLKIWSDIREFVLQFKSMQYKFRHIENLYQRRIVQRNPEKSDDIV